jgi:hypothetical protein
MTEPIIALASAFATAVGATLVAWFLARVRSGRLTRTLDQTTKVLAFVERWALGYEGLAKLSETTRSDAEKLMHDAMRAIHEDFAAERAVLPEFEKTSSTVRRALLLYLPNRQIVLLLYFLFHTMLLFIFYIFILRIFRGGWQIGDSFALLIAAACAVLIRLAVLAIARE